MPSKRLAQHRLAKEVLTIVHGETIAAIAETDHKKLFARSLLPLATDNTSISDPEVSAISTGAPAATPSQGSRAVSSERSLNLPDPSLTLPLSLINGMPLPKILYHAGLVSSKTQGRTTCASGGAYTGFINPRHQLAFMRYDSDAHKQGTDDTGGIGCARYIINGDRLVLRVGKQNVRIIRVVDDATFRSMIKEEREFPGIADWRDGMTEGLQGATR